MNVFERRHRRESETSEDTAGRTEAGGKHITVDTGRRLFGKADLFHTHTHISSHTHTHTHVCCPFEECPCACLVVWQPFDPARNPVADPFTPSYWLIITHMTRCRHTHAQVSVRVSCRVPVPLTDSRAAVSGPTAATTL